MGEAQGPVREENLPRMPLGRAFSLSLAFGWWRWAGGSSLPLGAQRWDMALELEKKSSDGVPSQEGVHGPCEWAPCPWDQMRTVQETLHLGKSPGWRSPGYLLCSEGWSCSFCPAPSFQ